MSLALKNKDTGDFIFFDVVSRYSRGFASQVSQHPVDGSGTVSDHVIKQNPKLQITGYLTGADFNSTKPRLSTDDRGRLGVNNLVVQSDIATVTSVSYDNNPNNLFPDVIGQLFTDSLPEISNISEARGETYSERVLFNILRGFYKDKSELILFEFDGSEIVSSEEHIFITNLSVNETAEMGDAFGFDITLEQITITELLEEELPEDVRADFKEKANSKVNRGSQSGNELSPTDRKPNVDTTLLDFAQGQ